MKDRFIILGARGSMAVSGREYVRYGGATTCAVLQLAGSTIVLDAGTGLLKLPSVLRCDTKDVPLILTHPHADHLLGLPMCPLSFDPGFRFRIYTKTRNGISPKEQISTLLQLPIWPVGPDQLPVKFSYGELEDDMIIDGIRVSAMEANHPGGSSIIRLSAAGKTVIFATDCVVAGKTLDEFVRFSKDADLLLIDGQYSEEEFNGHPNYGHNSWAAAARAGSLCGAKKTVIVHHNTFKTDIELDAVARDIVSINPSCSLAAEGMEVIL